MYALGIKNLLQPELRTRKVFFAVDGVSGGMLNEVKHCWRTLQLSGPSIGYFPNAGKTWLITKPQHYEVAKTMFADTGISLTTSGAKHLGAAIGEKAFVDSHLQAKVEKWCVQLETLSFLAIANPQYAYAVYTHGFSSKFSYIMRTIPRSSIFFEPIETILVAKFIPELFGRNVSPLMRDLVALPSKMGGLGISNPVIDAEIQFQNSLLVTDQLKSVILLKQEIIPVNLAVNTRNTIQSMKTSKYERLKIESAIVKEAANESLSRSIEIVTFAQISHSDGA